MALETLHRIDQIGGFKVVKMDGLKQLRPDIFEESGAMKWEIFEKEIRPSHFIYVRDEKNSISFTLQNGPIKEVGVNGCQVDTLIETARLIIAGLNDTFPCRENSIAMTKLDEAMLWLKKRKEDREARMVEGKNEL